MIPVIDKQSDKLLFEQVYEFYRQAILQQKLKQGHRLPSHRLLASELELSNNTVIKAYEQLLHEGYVTNEPRRGLFVCAIEKVQIKTVPLQAAAPASLPAGKKKQIHLNSQVVDETSFPLKEWRRMQQLAMDSLFFQYQRHEERSTLKNHLIAYLYTARGVMATQERIVLGAGMDVLFTLLALMLKKTHRTLLYEEPGYHRARYIFQLHDYNVKPLRVLADGIDVQRLQQVEADLLFLSPSHQYPTGAVIPIAHRLQILQWAKANNAYILEDDYDCEFRHKAKLIPALQSIDRHHRVIYFGTFTHAIMPSLRLAYMVLPEKFPVSPADYAFLTNTVPFLSQQTLAYFMEKGYWDRHLRKMRKLYREKYYITTAALQQYFGDHVSFSQTHTGLNILLRVVTDLSVEELKRRAAQQGLFIDDISACYMNAKNQPSAPGFLFEFGGLPAQQIPKVVERLAKAWGINADIRNQK